MSARSSASAPSVPPPRPTPAPPVAPPSSRPILAASKAYAEDPPVIRERLRTMDLEDEDLVDAVEIPSDSSILRMAPSPAPGIHKASVPDIPPAPAVPTILSARVGSGPDPTDILFDAVYELNFASSTWEAAGMCAQTLARALNARAVVIHTHDLERRELKAVGAHGDADIDVLGLSEPADDDLVASAVLCNQKSVTMRFDGDLPRIAPRRLHSVGAPRSVVAVPAIVWGRCVAIIEVIDADERYDERVADSAAYVAERFAEFLAENAA